MNKTLILPIVALAGLAIKQFTNFELSQMEIDLITEGVLAIVALTGIFMSPKKGGKKDEVE